MMIGTIRDVGSLSVCLSLSVKCLFEDDYRILVSYLSGSSWVRNDETYRSYSQRLYFCCQYSFLDYC